MSEHSFLQEKEKNILELLREVEKGIELGNNNLEYLVQNDPDLDRLRAARDMLEVSEREFEYLKKELSDVRKELSK
jgi:hypothetical protein